MASALTPALHLGSAQRVALGVWPSASAKLKMCFARGTHCLVVLQALPENLQAGQGEDRMADVPVAITLICGSIGVTVQALSMHGPHDDPTPVYVHRGIKGALPR